MFAHAHFRKGLLVISLGRTACFQDRVSPPVFAWRRSPPPLPSPSHTQARANNLGTLYLLFRLLLLLASHAPRQASGSVPSIHSDHSSPAHPLSMTLNPLLIPARLPRLTPPTLPFLFSAIQEHDTGRGFRSAFVETALPPQRKVIPSDFRQTQIYCPFHTACSL